VSTIAPAPIYLRLYTGAKARGRRGLGLGETGQANRKVTVDLKPAPARGAGREMPFDFGHLAGVQITFTAGTIGTVGTVGVERKQVTDLSAPHGVTSCVSLCLSVCWSRRM
jgi:hypothetical protein